MLLATIERKLYREADAIYTHLENAKDHFIQKGASKHKIFFIPSAIPFDPIPELKPLPENKVFTIIYVGAHGDVNDLGTLLEAARILKDRGMEQKIKFRLIGSGTQKPYLQKRSEELGITNIEFQDPVPKNEIYNKIWEADAAIVLFKDIPLYETGASPNKVFDYLVCGRPQIFAGNVKDNPVEKSGAGIMVNPENPKAIADATIQLSNWTLKKREEMSQAGYYYVLEKHTLDKWVQKFFSMLKHKNIAFSEKIKPL